MVSGADAGGGAPVAYGGASGVRFYLALANLLAVHATAALGRCCTLADLRGDAVGARVAYDVGGETLTLCEVLRRLGAAAAPTGKGGAAKEPDSPTSYVF